MPEYSAPAVIDAFLNSGDKDANYGAAGSLYFGVAYSGGAKNWTRRPIGNFDVSALDGRTINAAELQMYVSSVTGLSIDVTVSRCTRPDGWVENQVTWNEYASGSSWTSEGGDYDDTGPPAAVTQRLSNATGWRSLTGLKDFVTDALNNRNGIVSLILRNADETPDESQYRQFYSRENGNRIWRLAVDHDGDPIDNVRRIERRIMHGAGRGIMRGLP